MTRSAALTAASVAVAGLLWTVALAGDSGPFADSSAAAVGIGVVLFSVVTVAGVLLVRGIWVRGFATGVLGAMLALGVALPLGPVTAVALVITAAAFVGVWGPWLTGWFRQRPAAGAPPWQAAALGMAAMATVPLVGVAAPSGLEPAHGVFAGVGLLCGWGYVRTHVWGLWGLRLATVPTGLAAAVASPVGGAVAIGVLALGITALAWTKPAHLAVRPIMERLPGPRRSAPKEESTS